jgi:transcriptional regulator with XRE-family HTH domain
MGNIVRNDLGKALGNAIKRQRIIVSLTLLELANLSGVSPSYLARVERGERFPSARILRKIAKPLGFYENELFILAGYFSSSVSSEAKDSYGSLLYGGLDPYVARALAQQSIETQRSIVGILNILKSISSNIAEEQRTDRKIERSRTQS